MGTLDYAPSAHELGYFRTITWRIYSLVDDRLQYGRTLELHLATIDLGCILSDPFLETIKVTKTSTSWVQWASDLYDYWPHHQDWLH